MKYTIVYPDDKDQLLSESDLEMDRRAKEAVRAAIEKARFLKKPIALYDDEKGQSYIEYPDGSRKYAD